MVLKNFYGCWEVKRWTDGFQSRVRRTIPIIDNDHGFYYKFIAVGKGFVDAFSGRKKKSLYNGCFSDFCSLLSRTRLKIILRREERWLRLRN